MSAPPLTRQTPPAPLTEPREITELRELAGIEAQRLRAADPSAPDLPDLLDDLASRLTVLIDALPGPDLTPVRELIQFLHGVALSEDKIAAAIRILHTFANGRTEAGVAFG